MKITKKHNNKKDLFAALKPGDIFLCDNSFFIKTDEINTQEGDPVNAVCLDNGLCCSFPDDKWVKKGEAELTVEF